MGRQATPNEILEHTDALRRLAHGLVRDAAAADDALQDTLIRALQSPPQKGETTGAWLSTVLRNIVRNSWRSQARRAAREAAPPRPRALEAPDQRLERVEQAAALLDAMRLLSPEKHQVVELRYFEGLPPRAIAARLGLPVETVKTRLKRAVADLRNSLDATRGRGWPAIFAVSFGMPTRAIAGVAASGLPAAIGVLLVSKVLISTLVILLLLILGFNLWPSQDAPTASGEGAGETALLAASEVGEVPQGPGLIGTGAEASVTSDGATGDESEKPASVASPGMQILTGTVVLSSAGQDERPIPTGTLRLLRWTGSYGTDVETPIRGGRFSVEIPADERPEFRTIVVGSDVAIVVSPSDTVDVPADRNFTVKARFVPDTTIRVLDAESGVDLSSVFLQRTDHQGSSYAHPGPARSQVGAPQASPIRIPATAANLETSEVTYRVGGPGYGWRSVTIAARAAREHFVELRRGGSLTLHVSGPRIHARAHIRLRRKQGRAWRPVAAYRLGQDRTISVGELEPGSYVARVEIGDWFSSPTLLGTAAFTIHPGQVTETRLEYRPLEMPKAVPLAGEIHVPEGWPLEKLAMSLELLDTHLIGQRSSTHFKIGRGLTPVPDEPRTFRFDAGRVQEGRYELGFMALHYFKGLTLGPAGDTAVRVVFPDRVTVRIDVEGEENGGEAFLEEITWHGEVPKGARGWTYRSVKRSKRGEPFEFPAYAGTIYVRPDGLGFLAREQRIEVTAASARATLRVHPAYAIWIRVMDGEKQIPWDWDWPCKVVPVTGSGKVVTSGGRSDVRQVIVNRSGTYRVSLGPIPGYESIPDHEVEVRIGEPAALRIDVERRR